MDLQQQLLQYLVTGLTTGSIYALLALGFVAIYNVTGIINFAQGESAMLGAMLIVTFHGQVGLPLLPSFLLAVLLTAGSGVLLHRLAIVPARGASTVTLIIITIGASIAIRGVALLVWGTDSYTLPPFGSSEPIRMWNTVIRPQSLWVFAVTFICVGLLYLFFKHTLLGKAIRACAVNRLAAQLMGIRPERMSSFAFALGAALGAIAGAVIAPITYATYDMGTMLALKGFVAAIMGGLSSSPGAVLGGLLLGILEVAGVGVFSSGAKDAIAFAVLLLILFINPKGLTGSLREVRAG
jgi:branched-chain amino acid transport system permease protein